MRNSNKHRNWIFSIMLNVLRTLGNIQVPGDPCSSHTLMRIHHTQTQQFKALPSTDYFAAVDPIPYVPYQYDSDFMWWYVRKYKSILSPLPTPVSFYKLRPSFIFYLTQPHYSPPPPPPPPPPLRERSRCILKRN